jgi:hypothetical protein
MGTQHGDTDIPVVLSGLRDSTRKGLPEVATEVILVGLLKLLCFLEAKLKVRLEDDRTATRFHPTESTHRGPLDDHLDFGS